MVAHGRVFFPVSVLYISGRLWPRCPRLDARFLRDLPPDRATELRRILVGIIDARL
jgi:hypothetical protein